MRRGRQDHHQHPHPQPASGGPGNNHHKKKTVQQNNTNNNKKGSSDHKQNGPKAPVNNASTKNNDNNYHNNKNNKSNPKSRSSPPPPVSNQSAVHHQIQQHRQQNQNLMSSSYSSSSTQQQQGSTTASVVPTTVKMLVRANTAQSWGIQIFDLTPQTINNNNNNNNHNVRFKVEDVEPFSPAYHGGLRGGDVIVGVVESSDQNQNRSMMMNFRNFDEFGALLQSVVSIRLRVERRDDDRSGANHQYPLPPSVYSSSQVLETTNSHQPVSSSSSPKHPSSNPQQKDNNSTKVTASAKKAVVREEDEPILTTTTTTTTTKLMSLPDAPPSNGKKELGWLHRLVAPSVALPSLSVLSSKILTSAEDQKLVSEMKIPQREVRMRASSEIEAESKYFADSLAMKVKEGV